MVKINKQYLVALATMENGRADTLGFANILWTPDNGRVTSRTIQELLNIKVKEKMNTDAVILSITPLEED